MTDNGEHRRQDADGTGSRSIMQVVWGGALVLAGIGVFYRIPAVMQRVLTIEQFAASPWVVRFCFYLLGALLIAGGAKKIYDHLLKGERPQ